MRDKNNVLLLQEFRDEGRLLLPSEQIFIIVGNFIVFKAIILQVVVVVVIVVVSLEIATRTVVREREIRDVRMIWKDWERSARAIAFGTGTGGDEPSRSLMVLSKRRPVSGSTGYFECTSQPNIA
jgi:hypothetical protein